MKKLLYDLRHAPHTRKMKKMLHHLFIPNETNNYRAKLLHHKSLLFIIILFFAATVLTDTVHHNFPDVLGVSYSVTSDQLLQLTNQKRAENGAGPLSLNGSLSLAAERKANDMVAKNYWAHNSPTGTTPWFFIKGAGYDYLYAGENLARGFTNSNDTINAWMASPDHRRNMLSKNYQEVGFAVVSGKLTGEDTVLVVEEFGSKTLIARKTTPSLQLTKGAATAEQIVPQPTVGMQAVGPLVTPKAAKPLVNSSFFSKQFVEIILIFFIAVFMLDMIIVDRKKIVRFVGHNEDHIFYLSAILLFIMIILSKGAIL